MMAKMLSSELKHHDIRVNSVNCENMLLSAKPQEIIGDRTVAFVFLAREDTQAFGIQLDAKEWVRRDPEMFTNVY